MAGSPRNSMGNVRSDMDTPYPEHLSRLNRHLTSEWSKPLLKTRRNNRPRNRYRTQPVTFDEIQEVDEDSILDSTNSAVQAIPSSVSTDMDLNIYQLSVSLKSKLKPLGCEKSEGAAGKDTSTEAKSLEKKRRLDANREGSV